MTPRFILVASAAKITLVGLAPPVAGQMNALGTLAGSYTEATAIGAERASSRTCEKSNASIPQF